VIAVAGGLAIWAFAANGDGELVQTSTTELSVTTASGQTSIAGDCPVEHEVEEPSDAQYTVTDWAEFLQIGGRTYLRQGESAIDLDRLSDRIAVVCFRIDEMSGVTPELVADGDAAFLPVGTEIYAISGADSGLRVAIIENGSGVVYEAEFVADASTGAELIDLAGVTEIELELVSSPGTSTVVNDSAEVAALLSEVANGNVDLIEDFGVLPTPHAWVRFHRADGTTSVRPVSVPTGVLAPGVSLGQRWMEVPAGLGA
jgi:hypothetical protein